MNPPQRTPHDLWEEERSKFLRAHIVDPGDLTCGTPVVICTSDHNDEDSVVSVTLIENFIGFDPSTQTIILGRVQAKGTGSAQSDVPSSSAIHYALRPGQFIAGGQAYYGWMRNHPEPVL